MSPEELEATRARDRDNLHVCEHQDRRALLAEVDRLRAKIAAGLALADKWERGALRWADPLPVPPEVALIRQALGDAS